MFMIAQGTTVAMNPSNQYGTGNPQILVVPLPVYIRISSQHKGPIFY